jgi:antitoxin VapB
MREVIPMASAATFHTVALERDGERQIISIPADFALAGDEVSVSQLADGTLRIAPIQERSAKALYELISSWEPLGPEDAMPEIEDYPAEPVHL